MKYNDNKNFEQNMKRIREEQEYATQFAMHTRAKLNPGARTISVQPQVRPVKK